MTNDINQKHLQAIAVRWKARQNPKVEHDLKAECDERQRITDDPQLLEEAVREYMETFKAPLKGQTSLER